MAGKSRQVLQELGANISDGMFIRSANVLCHSVIREQVIQLLEHGDYIYKQVYNTGTFDSSIKTEEHRETIDI